MRTLCGIMGIVLRFSGRKAEKIREEWNYDPNKLAIKLYSLTKVKTAMKILLQNYSPILKCLHKYVQQFIKDC